MATQYRDVVCGNTMCHKSKEKPQRIWAGLTAGAGFYDWPYLTCSACDTEPKDVTDETAPAADIRSIAQGQ